MRVRVGISCVSCPDRILFGGFLMQPRTVPTIDGAIAAVDKIRFFKVWAIPAPSLFEACG